MFNKCRFYNFFPSESVRSVLRELTCFIHEWGSLWLEKICVQQLECCVVSNSWCYNLFKMQWKCFMRWLMRKQFLVLKQYGYCLNTAESEFICVHYSQQILLLFCWTITSRTYVLHLCIYILFSWHSSHVTPGSVILVTDLLTIFHI